MSVSKHLQDKLALLPDSPGCYIMKDENQNILYVGKAKVLKNRVRSYFHGTHNNKTTRLVSHIRDFEFIVTGSEKEALLLEINLIKKHTPPYNIMFMDDKTYPYIKVTVYEDFPRVLFSRDMKKDRSRYFGPYTNVTAVRETIDLINSLFMLRTCNRNLPRDIGKERPCLNFHMGRCDGFCRPEMPEAEYDRRMEQAAQLLEGRSKQLLRDMTAEMEAEAEAARRR